MDQTKVIPTVHLGETPTPANNSHMINGDHHHQVEEDEEHHLDQELNSEDEDEDDQTMPPLEEIVDSEMNDPNSPCLKKKIVGVKGDGEEDTDREEEEDEKDGWLDILSNGDLRKKVLRAGDGVRPQRGARVAIRLVTRVHLEGEDKLDQPTGPAIDLETFDRFSLVIGDNDLHQGLDLVVPLMERGELARVIIKPRFAYGSLGNQRIGVPENSTLDLEVELLEIEQDGGMMTDETDNPNTELPLAERIRLGDYKKVRGNFWFERGEYSLAIQCYRGAIKFLDATGEELDRVAQVRNRNSSTDESEVNSLEELIDKRAATYNNIAAAQMKLMTFDTALKSVEESLQLRPDNIKALFRRAKIRSERGDLEEAIRDLRKAASIDPNSGAVIGELDRLNRVLARQIQEQKELYKRMMSNTTGEKENKTSSGVKIPPPGSSVKSSPSGTTITKPSKHPNQQSTPATPVSKLWSSWPLTTLSALGVLGTALVLPLVYYYVQ